MTQELKPCPDGHAHVLLRVESDGVAWVQHDTNYAPTGGCPWIIEGKSADEVVTGWNAMVEALSK